MRCVCIGDVCVQIENEKKKLREEHEKRELDAEAAKLKVEHDEKRAIVEQYKKELDAIKAIEEQQRSEEVSVMSRNCL